MITNTDLFAGAGGSSTGMVHSGVRVVIAANHWDLACDVHQANHPTTDHAVADIHQGHWPWELVEWVRDPEHRASDCAWSQACWEAAVPGCDWTEYVRYDDDPLRLQTVHGACDGCSCPCHQEVGA